MHIRRSGLLLMTGVLLALCLSSKCAAEAQATRQSRMGPLAVHPQNPRYFQNAATGALVYLTGSHTWANLVDIGPSDPPPAFDFEAYVDWMAKLNHNFTRMWTWELVSWDTKANGEGKRHTSAPQPYARTGPGNRVEGVPPSNRGQDARDTALDGKPKFDLTQFNPAYFDRLSKRVTLARVRGIYVSVMLFEGWGLQFSPGAWEGHPFNPKNNINGIDGDTNKDGSGVEVHELGNPTVTAIQEAYVRKVVDTVNGFDNVLYEISNENHPASTQWQYHMIRFIKEYERTKPWRHPVGMTFQYKGGSNQALFDSPADWISPNPDGGYRDDPPPADGRKVILNDTDHLWGLGGSLAWVWKSFMRGYNPIFMDPYDGDVLGNRFDPKWDPVRYTMGYTRHYLSWGPGRPEIPLWETCPRPDLASTGYCLGSSRGAYLVFAPAGEKEEVTLQVEVGRSYEFEWFRPDRGAVVSTGAFHPQKTHHVLKRPSRGDLVLYVRKSPGARLRASDSGGVIFPGSRWVETSPELQGVDSDLLADAVDYLYDNAGPDRVYELMIIRHGCLIWEGSWRPSDKLCRTHEVHGVWSMTKSFTSTVLGLLIDDGKATLDTRAKDVVPALAAAYPDVTLRHFATMTSGYRAKKDEPRGTYRHGPSPTPFDPCNTPLFAPGTQYAYWDSAMNEFGLVLTRIAGEPIEDLFKRRIADRIGMNANEWNWGDFGKIDGVTVNGGSGNSNKHIFISARQIARLGHLFLNRGQWNGRQLISEKWVEMATKPQVPASLPLWPDSGADGRGVYGFNWWVNGIKANGQHKWPGAPLGTYSASGFNNNDMFVIPEWNMVIVRLGLDENQRPITDTVYSTFIEKVGQAITDLPGLASR